MRLKKKHSLKRMFLTQSLKKNYKKIHPYLYNNFPSPTINAGLMTVRHNDPENFIDDPEYF